MPVAWNLPRGCRGPKWRQDVLRPLATEALRHVLPRPTAPYAEAHAAAAVRAWAEARNWRVRADEAGNLLVAVPGRSGFRGRPTIAFEAHLDHPAMVVERVLPDGRLCAAFYGGHPPERMPGGRVQLFPPAPGSASRPRRTRVLEAGARNRRSGRIPLLLAAASGPGPAPGWIGAWDFPLRISARTISNPVCDDLGGVAAILAGLDLAARNRPDRPVLGIFTRCEENGFIGCLEAIRLGTVPRQVPVVVLECSPRLPHARPGDGPICRVGDRLSVYDPPLIARLEEAARDLVASSPGFRWQRKLMDGGACEATAWCEGGYRAAGLAVPLTNYHNVPDDRRRRGQAPEQIDRCDFESLVLWVATLALGRRPEAPAPGHELSGTSGALEQLRRARSPKLAPPSGSQS
ncbi:MAG: hypothetical protein D6702_12595 [Planctomycetota bacterium]|nr:MAG: hypothetical protein D6702_12595 [Planctomycetota bacterium]